MTRERFLSGLLEPVVINLLSDGNDVTLCKKDVSVKLHNGENVCMCMCVFEREISTHAQRGLW